MELNGDNRVLLSSPDLLKSGGVASYCRMLQPYLGSDADFITIGARKDNEKSWQQVARLFSDYARFWSKLKNGRYGLVHVNSSFGKKALLRDGFLLLMAKVRGCKVLVFIHGWDEGCEKILRERYLGVFQRVYFKADAFIVLANQFRDKLLKMGCDKTIYVETTTVDNDIFGLSKATHKADQFQILYLSRIEKGKGIYEALETFVQVQTRHPQVTLIVAGDGSELVNARNYAEERGITGVTFRGYISGKPKDAAFREADIFLFPTFYGEGMPINVLEAMACGTPVVTRPVGGLGDFFEDGNMGFISESKDPRVFAELVERLIVDRELRLKVGTYNRTYATEHFSLTKVSGRIRNIYGQLLQEKDCRKEPT